MKAEPFLGKGDLHLGLSSNACEQLLDYNKESEEISDEENDTEVQWVPRKE